MLKLKPLEVGTRLSVLFALGLGVSNCSVLETMLPPVYESLPQPTSSPQIKDYRTFADWCSSRESLALEAQQTVNILLQVAGVTDCKLAQKSLLGVTEIDLSRSKISDLSPLITLSHITRLNLSENQITDLTPVSTLTNLTRLNLSSNLIQDLSPLTDLPNLQILLLYKNQIEDISPLSNLSGLTELSLDSNQISDIRDRKSVV